MNIGGRNSASFIEHVVHGYCARLYSLTFHTFRFRRKVVEKKHLEYSSVKHHIILDEVKLQRTNKVVPEIKFQS